MKRWLPFLIINIIVSAVTTLVVISIWNKSNSTSTINLNPTENVSQPDETPNREIELPPLDSVVIQITNVFAAGDLNNELLVVERVGEGSINLVGWEIKDQQNNSFIFPEIELVKGQISIYTRAGANTVNTLFWGSEEAIFTPGETVRIIDSAGNERAVFTIP